MDKKTLNRIFILLAAGMLLLISILGIRAARERALSAPETPVVIQQEKPDIVSILTAAATPSPAPVNKLPAGAVTLLVDRRPVMTFSSENEARNLLNAYLKKCAAAPEGETFVSVTFERELILANPEPDAVATDYYDALTILQNAPSTVPVRLTTLRKSTVSADVQFTKGTESALPAGSRIIVQLGAGAVTETVSKVVYTAGVETAREAVGEKTLREARATILKDGTYSKKDPSGEPKEGEGAEGKSKGALKLGWPMRGSVKSHFGFRDGVMHNGVDVENKAGTTISAPGEGVVVYCGERGTYGFVVDIDHGDGFLSRLTHLNNVDLALHQRVFAGDKIGELAPAEEDGAKPRLHYELITDGIPYNPEFYLE